METETPPNLQSGARQHLRWSFGQQVYHRLNPGAWLTLDSCLPASSSRPEPSSASPIAAAFAASLLRRPALPRDCAKATRSASPACASRRSTPTPRTSTPTWRRRRSTAPRSVHSRPALSVNLELPTAAGSPLGGHIVQGHVDGTGVMTALDPVIPESSPDFDRQTTDWTLKVRVPENVRQWMVHKGSVAVEGISLTIAGLRWRGDLDRHSAAHLLAHQSAHARRGRAHEH